jgi:transcriptional regulator with XRE-family HTH domain
MPIPKAHLPKLPELLAFGEAVRRRRKALGYSQEAFGDECGIDRSYMGGIERGEHNLALVNILKIVRTLGVQPSEFFRDLDADRQQGIQAQATATKERASLRDKHKDTLPKAKPRSKAL